VFQSSVSVCVITKNFQTNNKFRKSKLNIEIQTEHIELLPRLEILI